MNVSRSLAFAGLALSVSTMVACASPADPAAETSNDALTNAPASSCVEIHESAAPKAHAFDGTLVIDTEFEHPTQGPTRPFILQLAEPRCVIDADRFFVSEIHLSSPDLDLTPFVGKKIHVEDGNAFAEHTAWHARDVVVLSSAITLSEVPTACLDFSDGDASAATSFEGKLVIDTQFEHPTQGPTRPFILQLATPRCVANGAPITEIHLSSTEQNLAPLVGQTVQVVDGEPFLGHTAWHARDVVVLGKTIVAKR